MHSDEYNYQDFKTALRDIDSQFVDELTDSQWKATLGYSTVVQREIVDMLYTNKNS